MLGTSNLALFMICSFHFGHSLSYGPLLTECKGCTEEYWPEEYWPEVVAVWTTGAKRGPYKNNRGTIFPSIARASWVSKQFIIWHTGHAYFEFASF